MSFEAAIRQKEVSEIESALLEEDKSDALFISDIMEVVSKIVFTSRKKNPITKQNTRSMATMCANSMEG